MKKRIALAAAAALAGGLLVAAPASAVDNAILKYAVGDGVAVAPYNTGAGVAGPANTVTLTVTPSATVKYFVTISGASATIQSTSDADNTVAANGLSAVIATETPTVADNVVVLTPAVGTVVVSAYAETAAGSGLFGTTASETVTITVNAAAASGVLSAANSTSILNAGTAVNGTLDATVSAAKGTTPAVVATAVLTLKDTLSAALKDQIVTATVAGPGLLVAPTTAGAAGSGAGVRAASVDLDSSTNASVWGIQNDGTAGVATVTFAVGTTTVATETVTFYGSVASLSAVVNKKNIKDTGATADVLTVTAKDAAGVVVPGLTLTATSGNTLLAANGAVSTNNDGTYDVEITPVADAKGAVTFTIADSVLTTVTTTASVTISDVNAATLTIVADKAEYAPGEKMTFTLTAKDANGAGLPDGTYAAGTILAAANPAISTSLTSYPFGNDTLTVVAGVATATAFAPVIAGPVSVTWTLAGTAGTANTNLASTLTGTTITVAAKVVAPVDATVTAINAKVASTEATVAALQVTVASVIKSLKVQWWLLKKIAVKVGIKLG